MDAKRAAEVLRRGGTFEEVFTATDIGAAAISMNSLLRQEVAKERRMAEAYRKKWERGNARIAQLEAELAEARKDSERLAWLISASNEGASDYLSDALWDDASKFFFEEIPIADCVRAAIDAARGAK